MDPVRRSKASELWSSNCVIFNERVETQSGFRRMRGRVSLRRHYKIRLIMF